MGAMMPTSPRKPIKVGVKEGAGPPPGYRWSVDVLDRAHDDAMEFLTDDQYAHMASQVREIAREPEPTRSATVDVRAIEDFFEIRDKGGILGKLNVRVFFFVHKPRRTIVVLGAIKKENDGQTSVGDKIRIRRRKRLYIERHEATD